MLRRSVFCPVDFSDASRGALRYAAAIAEHFYATLTVATVDDPLLSDASTITYGEGTLETRTRQELQRFVSATFASRALAIPRLQLEVATGKPATEILRLAAADSADLIVMSSHGRTGVGKVFFGSTTERVLRETGIPVLVTPPADPGPATLEAIRQATSGVLAPVDLTAASRRQLHIACGLAEALDTRLLILHVLEPVPMTGGRDVLTTTADTARRVRAEHRLQELFAELPSPGRAEILIASGDPAEAIGRIAREQGVSTVVMGLHSTTMLGPRMGSVTYRVLCQSPMLVLGLPPRPHAIEPQVAAALQSAGASEKESES